MPKPISLAAPRAFLFAAALHACSASASAAVPAAANDARLGRAIDEWARPYVDQGHLSGQLLVARHGRIVTERAYGWANVELRSPVTPETRFNVASITKPMTVLIALRLIEQGKLATRDSIARWFPDFPEGRRITVEHLLRHRSGIPHEIVPDSLATRPRTAAMMVELAKRVPLDFPPGQRSSYSSGGFSVLARVLELASGKDYESLLEEYVFGPLDMTHSRHTDAIALLPGRASCYVPRADGIRNAEFQDLSGLVGAGSVWSTARDVHRFAQGILSGRLGADMRQSFVRGGKLNLNGRTSGFRAFAVWDSASDLEIVFAGNVVTGAPDLLREAVIALAAGKQPVKTELPTLATQAVPEEELRRCEGVFQLGSGVKLTLVVAGGALYANGWPLQPTRDGAFFSPTDYGLVRPVSGADGRVERLDWTQSGVVYPAPRMQP